MGLTTDRDDPRLGRLRERGLQEAYLILSEEERAKGFVRPVRTAYVHVGRRICGIPGLPGRDLPPGKAAWLCSGEPGHEGDCDSWLPVAVAQMARLAEKGALGGCDSVTTMALEIAETYARDPSFYGGTYCGRCGDHFPVGAHGEFVWADARGTATEERVGT